ncbi:MAG: Cell division protein FtsQ [Anaerolineales bacterium]|nr:Cell division protein FtsQ [Anaerolineales bacterium]
MSDKDTRSRSDLVRARRKEQENRRLTRVPKRASLPTSTLPRRGVTLDASTRRAEPKPVRRYDAVAAAAPAAGQLQAPTMPRIRVGWRLLSFFLTALLGAGIYFAWTLPDFRVAAASLVGNQALTADEVESALHLNDAPIFLVVPSEVETDLRLHFPEIVSAKVSVELPNRVVARIVERQPVIRWEQDGRYAWVDAQGVIFRPRGERSDLVVVSASGSPPTGPKSMTDPLAPVPYVSPGIVESIRLLAPNVPQGSVLMYDPKYGLGWVDARGWTVWFGANPAQTDVKLRVYAALVDATRQRGITPVFINVAYPNAPYYRLGQ